jgi:Fe-S-cluster containining protein
MSLEIEPETAGKCSQCGKCCELIAFGAAYGGADWNEYYFRRGCEIVAGIGMLVPSRCPQLESLPDGKTRCKIYETRPRLCRISVLEGGKVGMRFYRPPGCTL